MGHIQPSVQRKGTPEVSQDFLKYLRGCTIRTQLTNHSLFENAFPWRCSTKYGSLGFIYEINQHARGKFLSIKDLYGIGENFAKGVFDYFEFSADHKLEK